jgi:hypothetical protein
VKVCPICGKDDLKHQGALNMHMYHCKMRKGVGEMNIVSRETIEDVKEDCSHSFRLLSVSSPIEAKAYKNGYMEVCRVCQELR